MKVRTRLRNSGIGNCQLHQRADFSGADVGQDQIRELEQEDGPGRGA